MTPRWWMALRQEWPLAAGVALLLALLVTASSGAFRGDLDGLPLALGEPQGAGQAGAAADTLVLPVRPTGLTVLPVRVSLPDEADGGPPWVAWVSRGAVDEVWLEGAGWRSGRGDFFAPPADDGMLPSGYLFPLPGDLRGDATIDLHVIGSEREVLRVRVVRADAAMRIAQLGSAISASVYAALFVLALLSLSLYGAVRDRAFLRFFAAAVLALLATAADNGHLYALPVFGIASAWRGDGIRVLGLLFLAAVLPLLQRYAGTALAMPRLSRLADRHVWALGILAAVCLLRVEALRAVLPGVALAMQLVAAALGVAMLVDAGRRRVPMAWSLVLLFALVAVVSLVIEFVAAGRWLDPVWLRYGGQLVLAFAAAVLAVGLVSRVGQYRDQRDQDRIARAESETRMRREAARADLNAALQTALRGVPETDLAWTAYRLMLDHLVPQVPVAFAALLTRSQDGRDIDLVVPQASKTAVDAIVASRLLPLKRHAANGIPLQQPVTAAGDRGVVAMEAVLPLAIRAPAWGVLLLQRTGGEAFTPAELALAGEFSRATQVGIEHARSAVALQRSAELDALTGTFNRRTIDQWLGRGFAESVRSGQPISVLFIDLDRFKAINDRLGHGCGDACLRAVSKALHSALSEGDLLGRYGGEEFIAVLPGRGGAAARAIGEHMRLAVECLAFEWEGQPVPLSASVGVATRLSGDDLPAALVERADKALYAAKHAGRNCVHVAPAVFS
ncbi:MULTISPECIES: diguanylate cyclase [unclassified Luteimonas]|uniref:diguanylate cyclase domain-containing protein n=1 Tax=unclassified Luteimonas TaxID=2629088 RepID=UPI0016045728|nr:MULTISPECIES: diguanylate cyclase [unclassified Luteimonas]MBB1473885.1 diguanylate cyclase [Luteimonas sp. MC1782]MBB6599885.1 diguanylate cyclase [Luteimonas sp. MC1825]QOC87598.1 diguanylate cyclase [Luteimonas sp. MC1825]